MPMAVNVDTSAEHRSSAELQAREAFELQHIIMTEAAVLVNHAYVQSCRVPCLQLDNCSALHML